MAALAWAPTGIGGELFIPFDEEEFELELEFDDEDEDPESGALTVSFPRISNARGHFELQRIVLPPSQVKVYFISTLRRGKAAMKAWRFSAVSTYDDVTHG